MLETHRKRDQRDAERQGDGTHRVKPERRSRRGHRSRENGSQRRRTRGRRWGAGWGELHTVQRGTERLVREGNRQEPGEPGMETEGDPQTEMEGNW